MMQLKFYRFLTFFFLDSILWESFKKPSKISTHFICFTIVLFPDSPAPMKKRIANKIVNFSPHRYHQVPSSLNFNADDGIFVFTKQQQLDILSGLQSILLQIPLNQTTPGGSSPLFCWLCAPHDSYCFWAERFDNFFSPHVTSASHKNVAESLWKLN